MNVPVASISGLQITAGDAIPFPGLKGEVPARDESASTIVLTATTSRFSGHVRQTCGHFRDRGIRGLHQLGGSLATGPLERMGKRRLFISQYKNRSSKPGQFPTRTKNNLKPLAPLLQLWVNRTVDRNG